MFAGKSSAIQSIVRRHESMGWPVFVVTNSMDTRYSDTPAVVNHDRIAIPATAVKELVPLISDNAEYARSRLVVVEEAQFFPDLRDFVLFSVEVMKKQVVCVGLDGDAQRKPFGQLLELVPYADSVEKYKALCPICYDGTKAIFTSRKIIDPAVGQISVGGADQYEPLCRKHYLEHNPE
jgi:thymidine kinase